VSGARAAFLSIGLLLLTLLAARAASGQISGTNGEPLISLGGPNALSTPIYFDTTKFGPGDASVHIQNCFAYIYSYISTLGGICDARGEVGAYGTGAIVFSVNPFGGTDIPSAPTLLLPCALIQTDVPIVVEPGAPSAINASYSGRAQMIGCTPQGETGAGASGGTTIQASSTFQPCAVQPQILGSGCTTETGITVTLSASTGLVGSSGNLFNANMVGCDLVAPQTGGTGASYGVITAYNNMTSVTIAEILGAASQSGATFAIYCPVTTLGSTSRAAATYDSYSNRVENVTLDCNGIAGCIDGQNWYSVEKSGYFNVTFVGYTNVGLDLEGTQAQDSGPYEHLFFVPGSGCTASTLDLVVRGSTPRLISDFSAADGHGCPTTSTLQNVSFEIDSPVTGVKDGHFENKLVGIGIGDNPSCPVGCPFPASSGTVSGVSIDRIDMSCSHCSSGAGEIIDLGTNVTIEDISIHAVAQSLADVANTLFDHKNNCAVTDTGLAEYIIGHTGLIESSSASTCHQLATGTITDTNGNAEIVLSPTSGAVDQITVANAATGINPTVTLAATGMDSAINLALTPKGTGLINANGSIASVGSINTNSSTNLCGSSLSCIAGVESSTGPTPAAGDDFIFFSGSPAHCAEESYNGGTLECIPGIHSTVTAGHVAVFNSATDIADSGYAYNAIPLNDVVSPTTTVATFADGNIPITFSSAQTAGSQSAMTFSEATAATGTGDDEVSISTANGSTSTPLNISQGTLTGSLALPALNISSTWYTSGTVDALIKGNVTNTASGTLSALIDLQVGLATQFAVSANGFATASRYYADAAMTLAAGNFTIGGNWGSGATIAITDVTSKDQAFTVTVTAGSSAIGANPILILNFANGSWGKVPVYICKMEGGSGTIATLTESATASALTITYVGTAASGKTYIISCIGMGT
jgi:hypothetical protein